MTTLAAGFLVLCSSTQRFLVLQAHNHKHWLPPKGITEAGESEKLLTTAYREFTEETGWPKDHPNFKMLLQCVYTTSYVAWGKPKESTYYLMTAKEELAPTLSEEHTAFRWVKVDEFEQLEPDLTSMHQIMHQALKDLSQM